MIISLPIIRLCSSFLHEPANMGEGAMLVVVGMPLGIIASRCVAVVMLTFLIVIISDKLVKRFELRSLGSFLVFAGSFIVANLLNVLGWYWMLI